MKRIAVSQAGMSIRLIGAGIAILLFATAPAFAQETPDPVCVEAEMVPIPKGDLRPLDVAVSMDDCDPLELRPSPGHPIDLRKTRYCAFAAREAKSTEQVDMAQENIAGNGGLAMIYAGGKGVTPSLPLAIRFACEIQDWDGDGREVGKMLDAKRKDGATRVDFDICERPTGRQMNYICILRDQNRANIRIEDAEKRLKSAAPPAQRMAFERLLAARKAYLDAHQAEEPSGNTGLVQTAMRDQVAIDDSWAQALDDYTAGKLPHYSASDFNKADVDLNAAYRNALKRTAGSGDGVDSLSVDQLVNAERAWIAYRDAWVAYAGLRWPAIAADSWRTWLTLERTAMLAGD